MFLNQIITVNQSTVGKESKTLNVTRNINIKENKVSVSQLTTRNKTPNEGFY